MSRKWNRRINAVLCILLLFGCFFLMKAFLVFRADVKLLMGNTIKNEIVNMQAPLLTYVKEDRGESEWNTIGSNLVKNVVPVYQYLEEYSEVEISLEDEDMIKQIIESEGRDEDYLLEENQKYKGIENENSKAEGEESLESGQGNGEENVVGDNENTKTNSNEIYDGGELTKEDAASVKREINLKNYKDFDALFEKFYALEKTTTVDSSRLNLENLILKDMRMQNGNDLPQILVYHTHSQEGYVDSIPGDLSTTVVGVGAKITDLLRGYGFNVIHDTSEYDKENRDYAYSNAAPNLEKILAENPSIEVIIDVHRDGVNDDIKLVSNYEGKSVAKFMFCNGLCRTKQRGNIAYLENENLDYNLAFAFQTQVHAYEYYPDLVRKIYLKAYRYNMQYRKKTLLVEVGAQTNTVDEAMNAAVPIAHLIKLTLAGE